MIPNINDESLYFYRALYLKAYDGDSVTLNIDLGFGICMKHRVRLSGINAPELRSKDEEEKARAYEARDYLRTLLEACPVVYVQTERDKKGGFGRILGTLYTHEGECINDMLVDEGYAVRKQY